MEELEQFTKTVIITFQRLSFFFKFQFGLVRSAFLLDKQTGPILLYIYIYTHILFSSPLPIFFRFWIGAGNSEICLSNSFTEPKHSLAIG